MLPDRTVIFKLANFAGNKLDRSGISCFCDWQLYSELVNIKVVHLVGTFHDKLYLLVFFGTNHIWFIIKTASSNFFLMDRRLSVSFKKGGFYALSAEAGAESATSQPLSSSYWLGKLPVGGTKSYPVFSIRLKN